MRFRPDAIEYAPIHERLDAARAENITDRRQNVHLNAAQVSIAEEANKHRRDVIFKVGDMVVLGNKNYNTERPFSKLK